MCTHQSGSRCWTLIPKESDPTENQGVSFPEVLYTTEEDSTLLSGCSNCLYVENALPTEGMACNTFQDAVCHSWCLLFYAICRMDVLPKLHLRAEPHWSILAPYSLVFLGFSLSFSVIWQTLFDLCMFTSGWNGKCPEGCASFIQCYNPKVRNTLFQPCSLWIFVTTPIPLRHSSLEQGRFKPSHPP